MLNSQMVNFSLQNYYFFIFTTMVKNVTKKISC